MDVGAAAEFQRERSADLDHPHPVGVLLTEHGHGAHGFCLVQFGDEGVDREVGLHGLVGDFLDLVALGLGQRALRVEVEAQITRPVAAIRPERRWGPALHAAPHAPCGFRSAPWVAPRRQAWSTEAITVSPSTNSPDSTLTRCTHKRLADLLHVGDRGLGRFAAAGSADGTGVGDLAAGLGVQRRAVQDDLDAVRRHVLGMDTRVVRHDGHPLAVDENAENPCLRSEFVESGELGGAGVDEFAERRQIGVSVLAGGGVGLGAAALLGHQFAEPGSSTVRPASAAISRVSSIGKP